MKTSEERWKDIPGWRGHYQASDLGNVRSLDHIVYKRNRWGTTTKQLLKGHVLSPKFHQRYGRISLSKKGHITYHLIHRLIALTWIGDCPHGMEVLHGHGGYVDNSVANLRYGTSSENSIERAESHLKQNKIQGSRKKSVSRCDGKTYDSMQSAAKDVGCDRSSISLCCSGQLKSVKGYRWSLQL